MGPRKYETKAVVLSTLGRAAPAHHITPVGWPFSFLLLSYYYPKRNLLRFSFSCQNQEPSFSL